MSECAPGNDNKDSCFSTTSLRKLVKAFNQSLSPSDFHLYRIDENSDRKTLIRELNSKIKRVCKSCGDSQNQWLKDKFIKNLRDNEINNLTFRPSGPNRGRQWLSTVDINKVMYQYQHHYPDYYFMGAVPIDFDDLPYLNIKSLNFGNLQNRGKVRIGIIFNLDEHYKSGSHWVAMYVDLNRNEIYYFDSYGTMPNKRIIRLIRRVRNYLTQRHKKKPTIYVNIIRHQYKNSECGVYCINFILRLLKGESYEKIIEMKTKDDEVNKCRAYYFRKT